MLFTSNANFLAESIYLNLVQNLIVGGSKKPIFSNADKIPIVDNGKFSWVENEQKYILSDYGTILTFDLSNGTLPLYLSKRVFWKGAFAEMLWMLSGKSNISDLIKQNIHIWTGWAYKNYIEENDLEDFENLSLEQFSNLVLEGELDYYLNIPYTNYTAWSELSLGTSDNTFDSQYSFLRSFSLLYDELKVVELDQTKWIIEEIKSRPYRKSYVASNWKPSQIYRMAEAAQNESVVIAPCHILHQVVVNNDKLALGVFIRSNDMLLGNPFNVAQYALLAHMYAHVTGFPAYKLTVFIGDYHVYNDQIQFFDEQVENWKNIDDSVQYPTLSIKDRGQKYLTDFKLEDFEVNNYNPAKSTKFPLTIVGGY